MGIFFIFKQIIKDTFFWIHTSIHVQSLMPLTLFKFYFSSFTIGKHIRETEKHLQIEREVVQREKDRVGDVIWGKPLIHNCYHWRWFSTFWCLWHSWRDFKGDFLKDVSELKKHSAVTMFFFHLVTFKAWSCSNSFETKLMGFINYTFITGLPLSCTCSSLLPAIILYIVLTNTRFSVLPDERSCCSMCM